MKNNLSVIQINILHILWSTDEALTRAEIFRRLKYSAFYKIFVDRAIDELINNKLIFSTSIYQNYSTDDACTEGYYSINICFDEFYANRFREISANNLFRLIKRIVNMDKFDCQMLHSLLEQIEGKFAE